MYLETERLILRRLCEEDFTDFCAYAADEEMCRMMGRDLITDAETARPTFDWLTTREERCYALVLRESGRVIGNLTVTKTAESVRSHPAVQGKKGCSMSFSLSRAHQRRGLMQEALTAVLERLFSQEGMEYVNCGNFDFNAASAALQRKLGFEPLLTERFEQDGQTLTVMENILWNKR